MKANEPKSKDLMIGDLVYACIEEEIVGEAKYKIISKIRDLKDNGDFTIEFVGRCPDGLDWQDGDEISWIEPIPLTPEILEKNGFKRSEVFVEWKYENYNVYMIYKPFPYLKIETEECIVAFPCEYIHQLQNALRLCGIEKEITL